MSKEREYYFIGKRRDTDIWEVMLKYGVLSASHFEVRFPDDPTMTLSEGREEFLGLPKISVEPWSGMKGAIAIKGEMTKEARELFLQIIETRRIRLWDFILFRDGGKLLSVSDFDDRIVTENFAKEFMEKLFLNWFEPIPEPEIKSEGILRDFLEEVSLPIQKALSKLVLDLKNNKN
ncbi:hypothetical protein THYS13_24810 [Thermoanaerobacter sp. YS13]|uniref:hypothetical protein n=1 Tax=Thermoanaerobacter sp. YS13 TaxID=1511746 RepID=UPI0005738C71|nr:hypothetical protein [Thermoanaerobacter sp. YS13]KHO60919.1 hypothetical protein THYS13_24810 [Thermoanaerobacter sp. YS13]